MVRYKVLAVATKYWRPKSNYVQQIIEAVRDKVNDGDFIVISEKAVSTAIGNIIDENAVTPTLNSKFIAKFWMRIVWGYFLGPLCRFQASFLQRLRAYPLEAGSRHKQLILQRCGLLQALMFGSEGGIDASNVAYSYVSLPLRHADVAAQGIRRELRRSLRMKICVMIADTDKTYSFRNFHFTPRPDPIRGIQSFEGTLVYVIGRFLKLRRRATPTVVAGCEIQAEDALAIAEVANRARGAGAGRTVWDMASNFRVGLTDVSWEMLETAKHKPIVILRSRR
jgi:F420-0:gamma-glutamyl ligase-like protein